MMFDPTNDGGQEPGASFAALLPPDVAKQMVLLALSKESMGFFSEAVLERLDTPNAYWDITLPRFERSNRAVRNEIADVATSVLGNCAILWLETREN